MKKFRVKTLHRKLKKGGKSIQVKNLKFHVFLLKGTPQTDHIRVSDTNYFCN